MVKPGTWAPGWGGAPAQRRKQGQAEAGVGGSTRRWRGGGGFLSREAKLAAVIVTLNICLVEIFTQIWWMSCRWPEADDGLHTRIAVVADPQLTDRTSYGFAGEGLALWGVKLLCDTYLVRAFSMVRSLRPEAVIFMGDLMDGARHYGAEEFGEAYARWRGIARLNEGARELHVAGNHDVGLGGSMCVSCALRFKDKISPLNYRLSVGNVTFVAVDTVTTAGSVDPFACMAHRHFRKEAHAFTSRVSEGRLDLDWRGVASRPASLASSSGGEEDDRDCRPRVLLTHIPLWRPSGTGCGEVGRAAGNKEITYMLRYTFQTTVEEELSATILEAVRPDLVLSGDDHDQCLVEHPAPWRNGISSGEKPRKSWWNAGDGVAERTVGTVSMLQGNIFPSIALLTLDQAAASRRVHNCQSGKSTPGFGKSVVDYRVCTLPPQLLLYYEYGAVVAAIAVILLLTRLTYGIRRCMRSSSLPGFPAELGVALLLALWDCMCVIGTALPFFIVTRIAGTYLI